MEHATGTEARHYTTGEAARECGVSVRTVQYYDKRGLVRPSGTTGGGRRLYSEEDVARLRSVCFLRELDLPLDAIGEILAAPEGGNMMDLLIGQQEERLRAEVEERRERLAKLTRLRRGLEGLDAVTVETIGDVASIMETNPNLTRLRRNLALSAIPVAALQWGALWAWVAKGVKWPAAAYMAVAVPWSVYVSRDYLSKVAYMCPQCHETFRPGMREALFANHTPTTRKLTCTECGQSGWCVEVWGG